MIRNILYSLSLHLLIITLIYLSFNYNDFTDLESDQPITISFIAIKEEKLQKQKIEKKPDIKKAEIVKKVIKNTQKITKKPKIKKKPKTKTIKKAERKKKKQIKKEIKKETKKEDLKDFKQNNIKENQNITKISSINLLGRERNNFIFQIKRCYKKAIEESGKTSKLPIKISVNLDIKGKINLSSIAILNQNDFKNHQSDLKIASKNSLRTLEICSPIRNLPVDKFEIWQEIELTFAESLNN